MVQWFHCSQGVHYYRYWLWYSLLAALAPGPRHHWHVEGPSINQGLIDSNLFDLWFFLRLLDLAYSISLGAVHYGT